MYNSTNDYYPATYQSPVTAVAAPSNSMAAQPQQSAAPQPQPILATWVQGEAGARNYMPPPGRSAWLMDAENDGVFYIKTIDQYGMPLPLRIYDYKERKTASENEYITRAELNKILDELTGGKPNG